LEKLFHGDVKFHLVLQYAVSQIEVKVKTRAISEQIEPLEVISIVCMAKASSVRSIQFKQILRLIQSHHGVSQPASQVE
jgi:hypothetical protein